VTQKLSTGQVVAGQFRVVELVRTTDVAEIYEAHDTAGGQTYALELITSTEAMHPQKWKSFEEQTRDSATLTGEVCTNVHEFGTDPKTGFRFLLREFVRAPSIRAQTTPDAPLTPRRVSELLSLLAPGFDKLHKADLAHRGLNPDNVFLADGPVGPFVRVADFGHAELRTGPAEPLGWGPPEQTQQGARSAPTTDTYSLALLAFFALTGHPFFKTMQSRGPNPRALQTEQRAALPAASKRAAEFGASIPKVLDDFFGRALAGNPSRRFRSVGEMAEEFARAIPGGVRPSQDSVPPPPGRVSAPPPPLSPGDASRPLPPLPPSKRVSVPPPPPSKTGRPPPPSASGRLATPPAPSPLPPPAGVAPSDQEEEAVLEPASSPEAAAAPPVQGDAEAVMLAPVAELAESAEPAQPGATSAAAQAAAGAQVVAQPPMGAALGELELPPGLVKQGKPKRKLVIGVGAVAAVALIAVLVSATSSDGEAGGEPTATASAAAPVAPKPAATPTATAAPKAAEDSDQKQQEEKRDVAVIKFECDPDCDSVTCDRKSLEDFASGVELKPGSYRCLAQKRGYLPVKKTVTVVAGEDQTVELELRPFPRGRGAASKPKEKPVPRGRPCNPFKEPC
jgi:serine/threonine protein kinase